MCEYMAFKAHYENVGPKEDIPVNEFMERIPPEFALELWVLYFLAPNEMLTCPRHRLLAADYYECKSIPTSVNCSADLVFSVMP